MRTPARRLQNTAAGKRPSTSAIQRQPSRKHDIALWTGAVKAVAARGAVGAQPEP